MAKRFGRNQKRKMREEIEGLKASAIYNRPEGLTVHIKLQRGEETVEHFGFGRAMVELDRKYRHYPPAVIARRAAIELEASLHKILELRERRNGNHPE